MTDTRKAGIHVVRLTISSQRSVYAEPMFVVEDSGRAVDELARALYDHPTRWDGERVVFVAGSSWTMQDVVTLCLVANTPESPSDGYPGMRGIGCLLTDRAPQVASVTIR